MQKIRLGLACMMANGMVNAGECTVIDAPTNLFDFFHSVALTHDADAIQGYFGNAWSNPVLFNAIGMYSTPTNHIHFLEQRLVERFKGEFNNGAVCLMFKDQQWHIISRVAGHVTDSFVPLHQFIADHYLAMGIAQQEIDLLGLDSLATAQVFLNENLDKTSLYFDATAATKAA